MKLRLLVCVLMMVSVAAVGSADAAPYKLRLDLGDDGLMAGWDTQVNGGQRFDQAMGNSAEPAHVTADFDDDGGAETVWIGYNGWLQSEQNSDPRPLPANFDADWPAGYTTELQEDFSGPLNAGSPLIIWNLPAGDYELTIYMRDWQYSAPTYSVEVNGSQTFSVTHADMVVGDLSSISDTQTVSTVLFDPAHADYDEQPSIYINRISKPAMMGIELTFIPVPEPATMTLLAMGGLALAGGAMRRRRRS